MGVMEETSGILRDAARIGDACVVAYSDGKDSRVVMDLCVRSFARVRGFFMELVPDLECVEDALDAARRRWGVEIVRYPHWLAAKLVKNGIYCDASWRVDNLPEWKLADVYALAMKDSGIDVLATGAKRADSGWRRRFMNTARQNSVINPIAGWVKYDVVSYLKARGIPLPPSSGHSATGIDLSTPSLLWLHDTYPDDFKRLCEFFPYAEAVVWRRKFYG
ncbi:MAG: phosphoadenosine phosphosulfate reductase family protein [FCB group bacterium]|jgi:phosphoadenosine phosphosulfate reductase|nr:phosphoadenosine phosphosulfate reductase family protein [FCB group bacterium]